VPEIETSKSTRTKEE